MGISIVVFLSPGVEFESFLIIIIIIFSPRLQKCIIIPSYISS